MLTGLVMLVSVHVTSLNFCHFNPALLCVLDACHFQVLSNPREAPFKIYLFVHLFVCRHGTT
jgi:hypothetical protein